MISWLPKYAFSIEHDAKHLVVYTTRHRLTNKNSNQYFSMIPPKNYNRCNYLQPTQCVSHRLKQDSIINKYVFAIVSIVIISFRKLCISITMSIKMKPVLFTIRILSKTNTVMHSFSGMPMKYNR